MTFIPKSYLGWKPVFKNLLSKTVSARGEQKTVSISPWGPFSSLFEATSCDWYFSDYASENAKVWKITISMLNNFFTIGLRAKNSITRV
jgi:hypothetical protein